MRLFRRPSSVVLGVLGAAVASLVLVGWVAWIPQPTPAYFPPEGHHAFVSTYDPPTRPVEVAANSGDGQAYAALAMDPTLARPEVFVWGRPEAAYRAQRPLTGWVAWALSAGRPGPVPYALAAITAIGVGVYLGAVGALARDLGRRTRAVPALLAAPGVVTDLRWLCPDVLAAGLGIAGLVWWRRRPDRPWPAVALLTAATLTRESLIVLPIAALLDAVLRRTSRRAWWPLVAPPAVFAAWVVVVRLRVGFWPTDGARSDRLSLPFVGFARGMADASAITAVTAVATLALALAALARRPEPLLRWVILLHLALASVMGESVWATWMGAGRALLPLVGVSVAVLLPVPTGRSADDEVVPRARDATEHRAIVGGAVRVTS